MGAVSKTSLKKKQPFKLITFEFNSDNQNTMFKIAVVLLVAVTVTAQACNEAEEFTCGSGECIPSFYRCDKENDCADQSDEKDCSCTKANNGFECNNGECIFFRYECDGERDCSDGSDEHAGC